MEIVDTSGADHPKQMRVTGKADWGIAYGPRKSISHGRAPLATEAKSNTTYIQFSEIPISTHRRYGIRTRTVAVVVIPVTTHYH